MAAIFPDDIFKCIFLNENVSILIKISLKFAPEVRINNIQALVRKNGLAPTRRQAIIWTNYGWLTEAYMSLGLNELTSRIHPISPMQQTNYSPGLSTVMQHPIVCQLGNWAARILWFWLNHTHV